MRTVRVGGFFTGIGAHVSACDRLESDSVHFEHVFQCEFEPKTSRAFDAIHGKVRNLGDVATVHDIGGDLRVDLLFWTPPCQDISLAGQQKGNSKDSGTRSALAFEVPRILANTEERERPRYLVMEEVPMMISKKFIGNFLELLGELSALGYQHTYGIMNAADYGVAQSRRRCFCISKLGGKAPELPKPFPLTKCLRDYLEPEPVADHYYLSEDRIKGLIWSNEKEREAHRGFECIPQDGSILAKTCTCKCGGGGKDGELSPPGPGIHPDVEGVRESVCGGRQDDRIQNRPIIEARPRQRTYANKRTVWSRRGTIPAISAHIAKEWEYLVAYKWRFFRTSTGMTVSRGSTL